MEADAPRIDRIYRPLEDVFGGFDPHFEFGWLYGSFVGDSLTPFLTILIVDVIYISRNIWPFILFKILNPIFKIKITF
jgi:hypothetical protein